MWVSSAENRTSTDWMIEVGHGAPVAVLALLYEDAALR